MYNLRLSLSYTTNKQLIKIVKYQQCTKMIYLLLEILRVIRVTDRQGDKCNNRTISKYLQNYCRIF